LRSVGFPPVTSPGRSSAPHFAEAQETKGVVLLELMRSGLGAFEFRPLPARPMVTRTLALDGVDKAVANARLAAAIESTPDDAVVQLRVTGALPAGLTAEALRAMAGARNVTIAMYNRFPFHSRMSTRSDSSSTQ
jgi:hypothetical protein